MNLYKIHYFPLRCSEVTLEVVKPQLITVLYVQCVQSGKKTDGDGKINNTTVILEILILYISSYFEL